MGKHNWGNYFIAGYKGVFEHLAERGLPAPAPAGLQVLVHGRVPTGGLAAGAALGGVGGRAGGGGWAGCDSGVLASRCGTHRWRAVQLRCDCLLCGAGSGRRPRRGVQQGGAWLGQAQDSVAHAARRPPRPLPPPSPPGAGVSSSAAIVCASAIGVMALHSLPFPQKAGCAHPPSPPTRRVWLPQLHPRSPVKPPPKPTAPRPLAPPPSARTPLCLTECCAWPCFLPPTRAGGGRLHRKGGAVCGGDLRCGARWRVLAAAGPPPAAPAAAPQAAWTRQSRSWACRGLPR